MFACIPRSAALNQPAAASYGHRQDAETRSRLRGFSQSHPPPRFDGINIAFHATRQPLLDHCEDNDLANPMYDQRVLPVASRVTLPRIGISSSSAFGSAVGCSRAVRAGPLVAVVGHPVPVTTVAPRCDMHCTASILHGRKQLLH